MKSTDRIVLRIFHEFAEPNPAHTRASFSQLDEPRVQILCRSEASCQRIKSAAAWATAKTPLPAEVV